MDQATAHDATSGCESKYTRREYPSHGYKSSDEVELLESACGKKAGNEKERNVRL